VNFIERITPAAGPENQSSFDCRVLKEQCTGVDNGESCVMELLVNGRTFKSYGVPGRQFADIFTSNSRLSSTAAAAAGNQQYTYFVCPMCSMSFSTTEEMFIRHLDSHFVDK